MANNVVLVKRTSTSGRTPNTTASYATNSQYIGAGELALNMADGILYSSNGSVVIEVGANNTNVNITGNATIKAINANGSLGTAGQVLHSNGSAIYWATDDSGGGGGSVYLKGGTSTVGSLATEGANIFRVNANTLNNDTTIADGENAQATGPLAIAAGRTLTIQTGGRVSII